MTQAQKQQLEKQLWAVANVLRGKMNADEYKNYILGFIFYKYLSEKLARYIDEKLLSNEKFDFSEIDESSKDGQKIIDAVKKACIDHLGFFLKPKDLFSYLVKKGNGEIKSQSTFILENLKDVLNSIEQTSMGTASEDDFKGLFDDVDLTSSKLGKSENKKNQVIVEVLTLLGAIDFKLEDSKSDLLGDAYEYLIGEFAAGAGKKGGEFYTPAQVSRLLSKIVIRGKKKIKSVYDPTCGSGSLLLRIGEYVDVKAYYGQELNPTTYNLARMNMILHGVHFDDFSIRQGDTLTDDMHLDLKAEAVVANPPFSADWKGDKDPALVHDERYSQYGRLAPKSKADYAFVTHMLHHLSDNGIMAVVLPHGALFRSGAEEQIRKYIIEKQNYLDAVIGLPPNIFYGTKKPFAILVFKKCRSEDQDIFFIDGSNEYVVGEKKNLMTDQNINKIFNIYENRQEIDEFSYRAKLSEVKKNNFDLYISRYVKIIEKEQEISIAEVAKKLYRLQELEQPHQERVKKYCDKLGCPPPIGSNTQLLTDYKRGLIQKLFSREIRFRDKKQKDFPDWTIYKLENVLHEHGKKSTGKEKVYSVSVHKGLVDQIEHLGRSYAAKSTSHYNLVKPGDVVYTKSPTGDFPLGIIKQSKISKTVIVSPLYGVFTPKTFDLGFILDAYFESTANTNNYLSPIVHKGAKNTIAITNSTFLSGELSLPVSEEEIQIVADFIRSIDQIILLKSGSFSQNVKSHEV